MAGIALIFMNTALVLQYFIVLQPGIPQKSLLTTLQMPNALIIDDETDIWMLLSRILRKHNFSTYFVNNLEAATKRLQQEVPAIIYLDNHLPDGLGLDFIQFLKTKYPQTKIVMITGHSSQADRNKAFNQGADMFLSKSFSSEAIRDTITSLL